MRLTPQNSFKLKKNIHMSWGGVLTVSYALNNSRHVEFWSWIIVFRGVKGCIGGLTCHSFYCRFPAHDWEASVCKYSYAGWHRTPEECAAPFYWMHKFRKSKQRSTALPTRVEFSESALPNATHSADPIHPCWDDTSVSVALSGGITVIVGWMTLFRW